MVAVERDLWRSPT